MLGVCFVLLSAAFVLQQLQLNRLRRHLQAITDAAAAFLEASDE